MPIKPLPGRIIVKQAEKYQVSTSIILTETSQEKHDNGIIVAIGECPELFMLKVDSQVMFGKYSGQKVKLDGIEYLAMTKKDIIAVMKPGMQL